MTAPRRHPAGRWLRLPARLRWTARRWHRSARPLPVVAGRALTRWARPRARLLAALAVVGALLVAVGPAALIVVGFVLVCPWLAGWRRAWLAAVLAATALATLGPVRTTALTLGTALAGWLALTHHQAPTGPPAHRPVTTPPSGDDRPVAPVIPLRPRPARYDPPHPL